MDYRKSTSNREVCLVIYRLCVSGGEIMKLESIGLYINMGLTSLTFANANRHWFYSPLGFIEALSYSRLVYSDVL